MSSSLRYHRQLITRYTTTDTTEKIQQMPVVLYISTSVFVLVLYVIDLCDELVEIRLVDHQHIGVE
jgi:hypothetical protein